MLQKKFYYGYIQSTVLASLFISKQEDFLRCSFDFLEHVSLTIHMLKRHDTNLLVINALWYLLFGKYPHVVFDRKLIKYRKRKMIFLLTFSKKQGCYTLFRLIYFATARQLDFAGYVYKPIFFMEPSATFSFSTRTLQLFYMIDFLYGQQEKSILTVKQNLTLIIDCKFKAKMKCTNIESLHCLNVPLQL